MGSEKEIFKKNYGVPTKAGIRDIKRRMRKAHKKMKCRKPLCRKPIKEN